MTDIRNTQLQQWLTECFDPSISSLVPLTGDAGFRRYFRFNHEKKSYIAVDSVPDKNNNTSFYSLAKDLAKQQVQVPDVYYYQQEQGFFCLSDLGDDLLANKLNQQSMNHWYIKALDSLFLIQAMPITKTSALPVYDQAFIEMELNIFSEWLIEHHLGLTLTRAQQQALQQCFAVLVESALEQPQVVMHRDFHSRNILVQADNSLAIIDFQDAVIGPATYDVVSLLRDCYVKWPLQAISPIFTQFTQMYQEHNPKSGQFDQAVWTKWFDLMGLQRHIKASGIFARLNHRDGKPGYLNDIPLTLSYIVDVAANYPELQFLAQFVKETVLPKVEQSQ